MKKLLFHLAILLVSCGTDPLIEDFSNPPKDARPCVWWHWMDGNVSREGIAKDLEWMHRIGIAGFQQFDAGGVNMPRASAVRYDYLSEGWQEMFRYALDKADSLGMDVTIASAPGWSSTGGVWVTPEDAMKKLEWSVIETDGGDVHLTLPPLPNVVGPYLDVEQRNDRVEIQPWCTDVAVVAVRIHDGDRDVPGVAEAGNGNFQPVFTFAASDTVRAVTLKSKGPCAIERRTPDGWQVIADIPASNLLYTTVNLPPGKACPACAGCGGLPGNELRARGEYLLGASAHTAVKIERAQAQGGFCTARDMHAYVTPASPCPADSVIDLSKSLLAGGELYASLPEGRWRIYRFGASLTGKVNHPASPEATGLEVDKLDPGAWGRYFRTYLQLYKDASGGRMGSSGISSLLIDSYEAGQQTWTPQMPGQFYRRRGYDLIPWLPVLAGEVIRSSTSSEAFLWDWRSTISELYEENYARVSGFIKEFGMQGTYVESHETGRALCADGMEIKSTATVPMSAIWVDDTPEGSPIPAALSDIRESASVAHIYGKPIVAAESFTAEGGHQKAYTYVPEILKRTADRAISAGVNRFVIHESASQPNDSYLPGLGLFRYGQWFHRNETWAEYARPWIDYLSRSCFLLQQGRAVADILLYYGEDTNATAQYGGRGFDTLFQQPCGFEYDYAGPGVLRELECSGGRLLSPGGGSYSVLVLSPDCSTMSLDVLALIRQFADSGLAVCGAAPLRAAGLLADCGEFAALVRDIWDSGRPNVFSSLDAALAYSGLEPDFSGEGPAYVHRSCPDGTDIYWLGNFSGEDIPSREFSFRCEGKRFAYLFNPEDGSCVRLPLTVREGRCFVSVAFSASDARFVVLSRRRLRGASLPEACLEERRMPLDCVWNVSFDQKGGLSAEERMSELHSWTESDNPVVRYFSGTAVYSTEVGLEASLLDSCRCVALDLGRVKNIAAVKINGEAAGILWKAPFETADVKPLLHPGVNSLEVEVTNVWVNRMIGDKRLYGMDGVVPSAASGNDFSAPTEPSPTGCRVTRVTRFYKASDTLLESGLLGPVEMIFMK